MSALEHALSWISKTPHGDNCYLDPDHCLGNSCVCGKDSLVSHIENVLDDVQDAALGDIGQPSSALLCAARAVVAAVGDAREAHFDLWQDDMVVASASGPRAQALQEIQHYAAVYSQDGPVQIEGVIRIPLNAAQQGEGSE